MNADEMFEELGYEKREGYYSIEYKKIIKIDYLVDIERTIEKYIIFDWDLNEGVITYENVIDKKRFSKETRTLQESFLDAKTIQAIERKCDELGWI